MPGTESPCNPGSIDTNPAYEVYERIKKRAESGDAKFIAFSGNKDTVEIAKGRGIPAMDNMKFSLQDFL